MSEGPAGAPDSLLASLTTLAAAVQRTRSVDDLLAVASDGLRSLGLNVAVMQLVADEFVVRQVSSDADTLQSIERDVGRPLMGMRIAPFAGQLIGEVLRERKSRFVDDISSVVSRFIATVRGTDMSSGAIGSGVWGRTAIAPLVVRDQAWGILFVVSDRLTVADSTALTLFASQISSTLEVIASLEELDRSVRLLAVQFRMSHLASEATSTTELAEKVAQLLGEEMHVDGASLYLLDGDRLVLSGEWNRMGVHTPPELCVLPCDDGTLASRSVSERRSLLADRTGFSPKFCGQAKTHGVLHAGSVPLISQKRVVGALYVLRTEDRPFEPDEVRMLESSASQMALAIERAGLLEAADRRLKELRLLLDVGRVITASFHLDRVLEESLHIATQLLDASESFILLLDAERRVLRGVAASDPGQREFFRTVRIRMDEPSLAVRAIELREPQAVADASKSTHVYRPLIELYGANSIMALPLLARDEPIGALVVLEERHLRDWSAAEIERATLIANQIGIAVANAQLFEALKNSYRELARTQEELVKRERLAALGELAAVVAHEVRNPVAVIFNALSTLRKIPHGSGDAAMLLGIVGEEADRLNRIVGDLLDFARPNEPSLSTEPLDVVISDMVEAATSQPGTGGIEIRTVVDSDLPPVRMDARMVRQALLNVVMNALQAMPSGGTLTVRAAAEERSGRAFARVDISDTGVGIPPNVAPKIFQPFFTTKASGTGLGLAVVKRIVEAHQGEVTVESRPGAGTTVSVRLPIEDAAPRA